MGEITPPVFQYHAAFLCAVGEDQCVLISAIRRHPAANPQPILFRSAAARKRQFKLRIVPVAFAAGIVFLNLPCAAEISARPVCQHSTARHAAIRKEGNLFRIHGAARIQFPAAEDGAVRLAGVGNCSQQTLGGDEPAEAALACTRFDVRPVAHARQRRHAGVFRQAGHRRLAHQRVIRYGNVIADDSGHSFQRQRGNNHILGQCVLVNIPDAAVLRGDGILHQQPVAFRAEHLNPAVGADPRASLRTADASAVRRGIHCVGLPRRKRHYLGVQRSMRNFRCTSSIRQGSGKTGQQRKQERHEFLHLHHPFISQSAGAGLPCHPCRNQDAARHHSGR